MVKQFCKGVIPFVQAFIVYFLFFVPNIQSTWRFCGWHSAQFAQQLASTKKKNNNKKAACSSYYAACCVHILLLGSLQFALSLQSNHIRVCIEVHSDAQGKENPPGFNSTGLKTAHVKVPLVLILACWTCRKLRQRYVFCE